MISTSVLCFVSFPMICGVAVRNQVHIAALPVPGAVSKNGTIFVDIKTVQNTTATGNVSEKYAVTVKTPVALVTFTDTNQHPMDADTLEGKVGDEILSLIPQDVVDLDIPARLQQLVDLAQTSSPTELREKLYQSSALEDLLDTWEAKSKYFYALKNALSKRNDGNIVKREARWDASDAQQPAPAFPASPEVSKSELVSPRHHLRRKFLHKLPQYSEFVYTPTGRSNEVIGIQYSKPDKEWGVSVVQQTVPAFPAIAFVEPFSLPHPRSETSAHKSPTSAGKSNEVLAVAKREAQYDIFDVQQTVPAFLHIPEVEHLQPETIVHRLFQYPEFVHPPTGRSNDADDEGKTAQPEIQLDEFGVQQAVPAFPAVPGEDKNGTLLLPYNPQNPEYEYTPTGKSLNVVRLPHIHRLATPLPPPRPHLPHLLLPHPIPHLRHHPLPLPRLRPILPHPVPHLPIIPPSLIPSLLTMLANPNTAKTLAALNPLHAFLHPVPPPAPLVPSLVLPPLPRALSRRRESESLLPPYQQFANADGYAAALADPSTLLHSASNVFAEEGDTGTAAVATALTDPGALLSSAAEELKTGTAIDDTLRHFHSQTLLQNAHRSDPLLNAFLSVMKNFSLT